MGTPKDLGDDTVGARIRAARNAVRPRMTQEKLARLVGVSPPMVSQWETGDSLPSTKNILRLSDVLRKNVQWLTSGEGDHDTDTDAATILHELTEYRVEAAAGGGALTEREDEYRRWGFPEPWLRYELNAQPHSLKMVRIKGDSMEPMLSNGDVVIFDSDDRNPTPPGLFILNDGIGVLAKQLEHIPNTSPARARISSRNPAYPPVERLLEEIHIVGRIVGAIRRL